MHTLNAENDRIDSWADTLMSRLGIRLISASAQSALAEMPIAGNTQPHGLLHGGAVELNISHIAPGRGDWVRACATAVHLGKSSTVHTVTITDEHDQTLAVARVSNRVLHN